MNVQRCVYQPFVKVNLHTLRDESCRSKLRPSFRVVPMVMPDNDTTGCSLGDVLQDIRTEALVRGCSHIVYIRSTPKYGLVKLE